MKIFDLNFLTDKSEIEVDLCIVGSGPAGVSIAKEFVGLAIRVLLIEAGGLEDEALSQSLYDIEAATQPRVISQEFLRRRALGGSSRIWTGRCTPFDDLDFRQRDWVPHSGWPFSRSELNPYLERAAANLGLAPSWYDEALWSKLGVTCPHPLLDSSILEPKFWQFSRGGRYQKRAVDFGKVLIDTELPNVEILLHANLTHINTNPDGTRFDSVDIASIGGARSRVKARSLILCCGGIENARLLLASNRVNARGVGNRNGNVGRYLMDHTDCAIWRFEAREAASVCARFGGYWLDNESGCHVYLHGLGLSEAAQENGGLLNCHAYVDQFDIAEDDPWGAISRIVPALRSKKISRELARDAWIALSRPGEIARGLYDRRVKHRPQHIRADRVELHFILEQAPDPESRVTLSLERTDALGVPLSRIDWRIGEAETRTAHAMSRLIAREFRRLNLPELSPPAWLDNQSEWIDRCVEKAHPSGTTRMSVDPEDGVVDENCQVHGIEGLFVAGSSVFPTSGAANPTLMIVAMALRLADRIKQRFLDQVKVASLPAVATLRNRYERPTKRLASAAIKVALVGTGQRARGIYLPILAGLNDQYEIVGFTAGTTLGARNFESQTGIESFASARELVDKTKPGLLVVAVPDRLNEQTIMDCLDSGVPILAETPLAWSSKGVTRISQKAAANKVIVGVAEQFPFLPTEQFKKSCLT